tara:strand:+ start:952 stop:2301 length:1350 start_codon:yes stop_codon:yes gene_type:complete
VAIHYQKNIIFKKMIEILFSKKSFLKEEPYKSENFEKIIKKFAHSNSNSTLVTTNNLINICDQISFNWSSDESKIKKIMIENDLNFLITWLKKSNIKKILKINFNDYNVLDRYIKIDNQNIIAHPKGVIVHWLAGNVPVLAIISLFQGLLTKNINIIKAPENMKIIITQLLNNISKMKFKISNKIIYGKKIMESVLVVYVKKDDLVAQKILSKVADVRVAWGGKSAIDAIISLPKKFYCDDIILGPRTSLSIVSKESLKNSKKKAELVQKIARDVFAFNQMGCNSPHNLYLENGVKTNHLEFIKLLKVAFEIESLRHKNKPSSLKTFEILSGRVIYSTTKNKDVYFDKKNNWNIFYDRKQFKASEPLYGNTLFVKSIDNINSIPKNFPENVQTIGVSMSKKKFLEFSNLALKNKALRFVNIGNMTFYNHPWDGFLPMTRMVNWVSFPKW